MRMSEDEAGNEVAGVNLLRPRVRRGHCAPSCGACCEGLALCVHPGYEEDDVRKWLELHGIRLSKRGGALWAWIPTPCRELQPNKECGLYGKPERQQLCSDWPYNQGEIEALKDYTGTNCTFYFPKE